MNVNKLSSIGPLLILSLLLCLSCNNSQDEHVKKIDALLAKSHEGMVTMEYRETIKYGKEAEALALQTTTIEKLPFIYLELADGLAGLELQKESLSYLDKIMKMDFNEKDKIFQARVFETYAYNYNEMGLYSQFLAYNQKVIRLLVNPKNDMDAFYLSKSYGHVGYYYYATENVDSSFYYYQKQEAVFRKFPDKENIIDIASLYNIKGYLHLQYTNQKDSALFYFQKSYDFKKKNSIPNVVKEYLAFGDYYYLKPDYPKALDYYLKAQQNAEAQSTPFNDFNVINKVLADTYEALQEPKMQSLYLKKYTQYNDSLKKLDKVNIDDAVKLMLQNKTDENSTVKTNYTLLLSVLSGVLLIGGFFLYQYFKKKRKDAEQAEKLLKEQEEIIIQKDEETQELKVKVNESFHEIIALAKSNDPAFLARFQEVYPEFTQKLLEINPTLVSTELRFCALLFFNFTIKDIAEYTFISPKSVQNRKNRIRKRLDIPADADINRWFQNIIK